MTHFWIKEAPLANFKEILLAEHNSGDQPRPIAIEDLPSDMRAGLVQRMRAKEVDPYNENVLPEHKANAEKLNLEPIKPAQDPGFLYNHNPLYSGTMAFNITIDMKIWTYSCEPSIDYIWHCASLQCLSTDQSHSG